MANNTEIISRPVKSGCNFNAVGQPIVYKLRREDYQFAQINDNGGFAQIQINATDLTTYFELDDEVYIEGLGSATVTASSFSTNTLVTVDIAFTSTSTGFINNNSKRTDYKIEAEVFSNGVSLGPRIIQDPGENGEVLVNVSGIVKTFTRAEWADVTVSDTEENTSIIFYIKYQEFYDVTLWELIDDVANLIVGVFASIPMFAGSPPNFSRYLHGGNLLSYYPEDNTRKFLTRMNPVMWKTYPFTLSFLWVMDTNRRVQQFGSDGDLTADTTTVLTGEVNTVHRMEMGDLDEETSELIVSLLNGTVSGEEEITEDLTIEVREPCDNGVMLFWKNSVGGDAYWMFDESQEYEYTYPGGRKVKRLNLFADNLKIDQWDAINELNSNTEVIASNIVDYAMDDSIDKTHFRNDNQVYILTADLIKTGVIVIANPMTTRTHQVKHAIDITIELPELYAV